MTRSALLLTLLLFSFSLFSQNPDWIWAKKQGGSSNEFSLSVCTDPSGNIITCGYFISPTLTIGSNTLTNAGLYDIFLIKHDNAGNPIWAVGFGSDQDDYANAVAADSQGNIYVTGYFSGASITFGSFTLTNFGPGTADLYLIKVSPAGTVLWAKAVGGNYWDVGQSVCVDPGNGAVYLAGYFSSTTLNFGTGPISTYGLADAFLSRHDPSNGNTLWVISGGGEVNDLANGVDVDANGNVFIAGGYASDTITFGSSVLVNAGAGFPDIFTAKFTSAGVPVWAVREGGPDNDHSDAIAIDGNNNVIVGGHYHSTSFVAGTTTLVNGGMGDPYIMKYDNAGNILWAKDAGGIYNDFAYSVAADAAGNAYLAGMYQSPSITFGSTTLTNSAGFEDLFLVKYDPSGNEVWALGDGNNFSDYINDIYIDPVTDELFATGDMFSPTLTLGTTLLTNLDNTGNTADVFISKLGMVTSQLETPLSGLSVYPNPNNGFFYIYGLPGSLFGDIHLTDLFGRALSPNISISNGTIEIQIKEAPGIYLLNVQTDRRSYTTPIIVR